MLTRYLTTQRFGISFAGAKQTLDAFRVAWTEIAKEEGDQDAFFKEVLDDIESFRAKFPSANAP